MREFWRDFSAAIGETKDLRTTRCSTRSTSCSGPHIFPDRGDGANPRTCPTCGTGQLSLKLGKFGSFIGCSNYPECKFTRQLAATGVEGEGDGTSDGGQPGGRFGRDTGQPA
jgi:DNA topoisomerase-1